MSMPNLRPYVVCTIDGVPTRITNWDTSHGTDQPVATGSITLPLPLPSHLAGGEPENVLNHHIVLQAGYRGFSLRTVFSGVLDSDSMNLARSGYTNTIQLRGYGSRLAWRTTRELRFPGNMLLEEIIRSLCEMRGVVYRIDRILTPSGQQVRMGGNPHIENGEVVIRAKSTPLDWITRMCELFGYRAFDTAQEFRVQRVSGTPTLGPMGEFREGLLIHQLNQSRKRDSMVTAWTVEGATYTDDDGIEIPIRSIPGGAIPSDPLLDPPGWRDDTVSDGDLVSQVNADAVRQVLEIDYSAPGIEWTINTRGNSLYRPGATVRIASTNMEAPARDYWIRRVRQSMSRNAGYKSVLTAWAGGGTAMPDGEDLQTINVRTAPVHLGDETIPWYAQPSPSGKTFPISVSIPDTFTSLAISLYLHGSNSYLIDGANTESTVSKIEVWQGGEKPVGTVELPANEENYNQQLPYGSGLEHWTQVRLPVPGRLEPGEAEIRIVAGEDKRLPESTKFDDFELRNITLELRGAGTPQLPGGS